MNEEEPDDGSDLSKISNEYYVKFGFSEEETKKALQDALDKVSALAEDMLIEATMGDPLDHAPSEEELVKVYKEAGMDAKVVEIFGQRGVWINRDDLHPEFFNIPRRINNETE